MKAPSNTNSQYETIDLEKAGYEHIARCFRIIDLGTQPVKKSDKYGGGTDMKRQVRIIHELPLVLMEGTYDEKLKGQPFAIAKTYTFSMYDKANLRKDLAAWRGRDFTDDEAENFELRNVLGKLSKLNLILSKDGKYTNIGSINPAPKDAKAPEAVNKPVLFSLDPLEFDSSILESFSEKLQEKIKTSPEYKALKKESPASHQEGEEGEEVPF